MEATNALLARLKQVSAGISSATRFEVLRFAASHSPFTIADVDDAIEDVGRKTLEGHVRALESEGLVAPDNRRRLGITAAGEAICRFVGSAPDAAPSLAYLSRKRLLAVSIPPDVDPAAVETLLGEGAESLLLTEQDFDLVGIYPDDRELVQELRAKAHAIGVTVRGRARVAAVQMPSDSH